ncbi:MAG: Holliday junction branch migration protein RuvA, partial [Roseicyclus sp.]|nr:Holliday junction branch migration protein RuvA [Roseicyclus sp.]
AGAGVAATGAEPADVVVEDDTPRDVPRDPPLPTRPTSSAQAEALSALQNLGYAPADAAQAVVQAADGASDTADLIRTALRLLAPKD